MYVYGVMIKSLLAHDKLEEALGVMRDMIEKGIMPDEVLVARFSAYPQVGEEIARLGVAMQTHKRQVKVCKKKKNVGGCDFILVTVSNFFPRRK